MNERGDHPSADFERAQNDSDHNSTQRSFHEPVDRQEVAAAYGRRARRAIEGSADTAVPPTFGAEPASDAPAPAFRVRDFRPGSGPQPQAAPQGTDAAHEAEPMRQVPQWAPPTADREGQLAYYTQGSPAQLRPPAVPPPVVNTVPAAFAAPPRPLTRRQMRELEVSQGIRQQADDAPQAEAPAEPAPHAPFVMPAVSHAPTPVVDLPVPLIEPVAPPAPAPAATQLPAVAEHPAVAEQPAVAEHPAVAQQPVVAEAPAVIPAPVEIMPPPVGAPIRLPERSVADQPAPPAAPPTTPPPLISPEPIGSTDAPSTSVRPGPQTPQVNRGIDLAPEIFTAPVDHWSNQNHIEIGDQGGDAFIRTVGTNSGALTTSALVMPSIPQTSDMTKPFGSTGEILITGSIDLPRTLGSTGAHPTRFDHSDIDALFAEEDHDYAPADASPVRAIRAVSTHTSTHGVISAKKPPSNRLPMLMAVTAGILAVGVVALLAAGMIFGYF